MQTRFSAGPAVLKMTAEDPHTEADVLLQLADHPHSDVRQAVARNKRAPAEVLAKLAADTHWRVSCLATAALRKLAGTNYPLAMGTSGLAKLRQIVARARLLA